MIYGTNFSISATEARNAIKSAREFIKEIIKIIQHKNPQKNLFKSKQNEKN